MSRRFRDLTTGKLDVDVVTEEGTEFLNNFKNGIYFVSNLSAEEVKLIGASFDVRSEARYEATPMLVANTTRGNETTQYQLKVRGVR